MARPPQNLEAMLEEEQVERDLQEVSYAEPVDPLETDPIAPAEPMAAIEETPVIQPTEEPIQVAGRMDVVTDALGWLGKRTEEAIRKATPVTPEEPVIETGEETIIRPASPEEEADFATALGVAPKFTKGLNLPAIAEASNNVDLADYMQKIKDNNAQLFDAARRGSITYSQLLAGAEARGIDNLVIEFMQRQPGDAAVAEDVLAATIGAFEISKRARALAERAFTIDDPELREQAFASASQLIVAEATLYANISGAVSEAGRVLFASREMQRVGLGAPGRGDELITLFDDPDIDSYEAFFELYLAIPDDASRSKFVQKTVSGRVLDFIAEGFINSILSSPVTHGVNIAGNAAFSLTKGVEETVAGGIGLARSAITGNKDRMFVREGLIQLDALRSGYRDAAIVAGASFKRGEPISDGVSKLEMRRKRSFGTTDDFGDIIGQMRRMEFGPAAINTLGVYYRMASRFLITEDEFFKAIAYQADIKKQALRRKFDVYDQAIQRGESPGFAKIRAAQAEANFLANPPEPARRAAGEAGTVATFQGDLDGLFGKLGRGVSHPLVKLFAIPFFKTPMNIMGEAFKRTPFAMLHKGFYDAMKKGGREADLAIGRMATGTAMFSMYAWMSWGGDTPNQDIIIIGSGPTDKDARKAMERQGFYPFTINIRQEDGSYKGFTYSRFDPVSGILAMSADFAYFAQYSDYDIDWTDPASVLSSAIDVSSHGVAAAGLYALEMPYLQGMTELMDVLDTSQDPDTIAERLQRWLADRTTTAVVSTLPSVSSLSAAYERVQNPDGSTGVISENIFDVNVADLPPMQQGFYAALQRAMSRNPFFSDQVPPALNLWGEVMKQGQGYGYEMINPVRISNAKYTIVDKELMRLGDGIQEIGRKMRGTGVALSAEQRNDYITFYNQIDFAGRLPGEDGYQEGQTLLDVLAKEVASRRYAALATDTDRLDVLRNIVARSRRAARERLYIKYPELKARIDAAK